MPKALVAMSGGLDSSVTAYLLQKQGFEVTGITMFLGVAETSDYQGQCCGMQGITDAREVCDFLNIPHRVAEFSQEFDQKVITPFVNAYRLGRTPNPCIQCNEELKFDLLMRMAEEEGFDCLATGHYAKILNTDHGWELKCADDHKKDQSYFLYRIPRERLSSINLPLGTMHKEQVRTLARELKLPVAEKKESQDICFIPGGDYRSILLTRGVEKQPGFIRDIRGNVIGSHEGIAFYTVGQRKGLGIHEPVPYYVLKIEPESNTLIAGPKEMLKSKRFFVSELNLLCDKLPEKALVRIRYQHKPGEAKLILHSQVLEICFDQEQEAITPGQAAVIYCDDTVIGGGVIREVEYGYC